MWTVEGMNPNGKQGDVMEIEAPNRAAAEALFLEAHPGWEIVL